jgi:hypothetical protein
MNSRDWQATFEWAVVVLVVLAVWVFVPVKA